MVFDLGQLKPNNSGLQQMMALIRAGLKPMQPMRLH